MKNRRIGKKLTLLFIGLIIAILAGCSSGAKIPNDYNYDDLTKYIKLGEYKGVEYTKITGDVSDKEVKEYIDARLAENAETTEVKEGVVKEDSVVNIDYVGSVDGVEFEGGTASDVELDIANSGYIAGFAEGIVGHEVGETFDLNVTFPEDYGVENLNGQPAVFKTTINYIVEKKTPKYNDEWVAANTEYKTTEEYENSVREEMKANRLETAESDEYSEIFQQILSNSEVIEYPEKELEAKKESVKAAYGEYAKNSNVTLDEFISSQGLTQEQFDESIKAAAESTVKNELVLYQIAKLEDIKVSKSEYNDFLDNMLKESGYTEESFKTEMGKSIQEYANDNNLYSTCLYRKVMEKVMEYSVGK